MQKNIVILIILVVINNIIVFTPQIPIPLYYGVLFLGILVGLRSFRGFTVNIWMLLFLFGAFSSILLNEIPVIFKPWQRFLSFLLLLLFVGPLIQNNLLAKMRVRLFMMIGKILIIISSLSFLLRITGIFSGTGYGPGFCGICGNQLLFGAISAMAGIFLLYFLFEKKYSRKKEYMLYAILCMIFFSILLSGARAALMGFIAGAIFFLYKKNQHKLSKFIRTVLLISIVVFATFPLWSDYSSLLVEKTLTAQEGGDAVSSRSVHWESRIEEFESSPIFGIGFASVDIKSEGSLFNASTGRVETGNSWFSLLSMTGLMGFIPIAILIIMDLYYIVFRKKGDTLIPALLGGLLIFFCIHMMAEGYILGSGSFLCFGFWLTLGVIEAYKYKKNIL